MKNPLVVLLTFLLFLGGSPIFSQTNESVVDTAKQIDELSIKLSKSPLYTTYIDYINKIGTNFLALACEKRHTVEERSLPKEAIEKVSKAQH